MRWPVRIKQDDTQWHSWFAWHPVRIVNHWVWWEYVVRRKVYHWESWWEYKYRFHDDAGQP